MIEISDWYNIEGFLTTMDVEKAFNFLGHAFLSSLLRKLGLGKKYERFVQTTTNLDKIM